ncbi:hypothetical protein SRHO_G00212300 [Serrasalmus rhombeus]
MLQALQYIQSLNQRTPHDPVTNNDLNDVRTMLQLAVPEKTSTGRHNGRGEEEERDGVEEKEEDKGQHWIQAVLNTLQQTDDQRTSLKTPYRATSNFFTPTHPLFPLSPASESKQQQHRQSDVMNYGRSMWANQGIRRRHRKFPLMFEDERGQNQPLKRSNENAEQYTPQKLATLQSVFEELSRIVNSKADSKQQDTEDGDGENSNEDEDDDEYREKKTVFEDVAGEEEELMPLEQKTEQEKEEAQGYKFNDGFGNGDEEQDKEGNDVEGDDEDERSNQSDVIEMEKVKDPDDINRLVNYYLMKILENTGTEKQRRDQEKEKEQVEEEEEEEESDREEETGEQEEEEDEQREKRRAAQLQYSVDPQSVYQLIQISKKLQIPSEDILDLLEDEETKKPDKSWQHTQAQSKTPSISYTSSYNTYKNPATTVYQQPLETPEKTRVTQNILRILGLDNAAQPNKSLLRPNQYKSALNYYIAERELPDYTFSENSRNQHEADYDDTVGEDELASYLAAEMFAERPRRAPLVLERTVQDYFAQDGKSMPEETQAEHKETAENSDEETLLRIMDYLNPESEDTDKTHINRNKMTGM